ncbi:MAG: hypothetical protein ACLP9Y_04235 [Mycobacterium sp.]
MITAQEQRVRRALSRAGWRLEKSRKDGTYQASNGKSIWKAESRDQYGLSLDAIEKLITQNPEFKRERELHPLAFEVEKAIAKRGGNKKGGYLQGWRVLENDPFLMDTPGNRRNAQWLVDALATCGIDHEIHPRGIHYAVLMERLSKPNGEPYKNTDADSDWIEGVCSAARWLGYIDFDMIEDHKHPEPYWAVREEVTPEVWIDSELEIPDADELRPTVTLSDFEGTQPYRIALIGEKTSLRRVLKPISERYGTDLCLLTGCISDTRIYQIAKAAYDDGRPLVVGYFSDCDPWGWNMADEASRKLQALAAHQLRGLEFRVYRVALRPDQVHQLREEGHELPESPIEVAGLSAQKQREKAAKRRAWMDAMGVEQIEIDALATLNPELLEQIAIEFIERFYDTGLDQRVRDAGAEWVRDAQAAVDAAIDTDELNAAVEEVDRLRGEIQSVIDERIDPIRDDAKGALPDAPDVPEPEVDPDSEPEPLADSGWSFAYLTQQLQKDKQYDTE